MSRAAIAAHNVCRSYGAFAALSGVNLEIAPGEFVSLVGPSGSGKTTLLRLLGGFDQPDSGIVSIAGKDVTGEPPERRPTNTVFQRGALFPHMTVGENIAYPLRRAKLSDAQVIARVQELLAVVRLSGFADRKPAELSGGQAQRIALARALAARPPVLLLDEPFSALDPILRRELQLELRRLRRDLDCAFVFVTHDHEEALVLSDRIAVMERGRIVQIGSPAEVYLRPANLFTSQFVGEMNVIDAALVSLDASGAQVSIGGAVLHVDAPESPIQVGTEALLLVRPETIRLCEPGAGSHLNGVIEEVVYLGSRWRIRVRCTGLPSPLWIETSIHDLPSNVECARAIGLVLAPAFCRLMPVSN